MQRAEHEKLDVYHKCVELAGILDLHAQTMMAARPDLSYQLRRASASVVLNLAEGASEFSRPDKARFYRFSRRSAAECMAIIDVGVRVGSLPVEARGVKRELMEVSAMLTRMILSNQQ